MLSEGAAPPANYRDATGVLLLEATPSGKVVGGSVVMSRDRQAHVSKLSPRPYVPTYMSDPDYLWNQNHMHGHVYSQSTERSSFFTMKAENESGRLKLKVAAASDANGDQILVGTYKTATDNFQDSVRCFRASDATDDRPFDDQRRYHHPATRVGDRVVALRGHKWLPGVIDEVVEGGRAYKVAWNDEAELCSRVLACRVRALAEE